MGHKGVATLASLLLLAGCATTWHNPHLSSATREERQLVIDEGYCQQAAHGSVPMPDIRIYNSADNASGYRFSGRLSTQGANGSQTSYYSGSMTPIPNPSQSFNHGLAQGAALGAAIRARRAQDAIYKSCRFRLGWLDKPIEAEPKTSKSKSDAAPIPSIKKAADNSIEMASRKNGKEAGISCDRWAGDIAKMVDSAYTSRVERSVVHQLAGSYLDEVGASGRERLMFDYVINARYSIPLENLSSENYPRFVRWECERDWSDIGLSKAQK